MKKLITLLLITTLTITAIFASTDERNINIGGSVESSTYDFSLIYNDKNLNDGDTLEETYDLSKVSTTDNFIVRRSAGNLNYSLIPIIEIRTNPFIGEFNGDENYNTGLTPEIYVNTKGYNYIWAGVTRNRDYSMIYTYVTAGANEEIADLASFYLKINGNDSIPAGNFSSTVRITYYYD